MILTCVPLQRHESDVYYIHDIFADEYVFHHATRLPSIGAGIAVFTKNNFKVIRLEL